MLDRLATLFQLRPSPLHLGVREVPVAVVDRVQAELGSRLSGADQPCEGEQTWGGRLSGMRQPQQHIGDESNRNLSAHCVLGRAEELADPQCLLDPAEEQLDLPAVF